MADNADGATDEKKGRGRPKKASEAYKEEPKQAEKRGRGRSVGSPKKDEKRGGGDDDGESAPKRGRGRPKGSTKKGRGKTKTSGRGGAKGGRGRGRPKRVVDEEDHGDSEEEEGLSGDDSKDEEK